MFGIVSRPKQALYQSFIWMVVIVMMVSVSGCGQDATPTAVALVTTGPADTPTPQPTSTPIPTATPTEIPIVLPTATPPNAPLPATAPIYDEPFTAAATSTANPTSTPAPSVTPYVPPLLNTLAIFSFPLARPVYAVDYIPPPQFSTSCIFAQHYESHGTPTPTSSLTLATTPAPGANLLQAEQPNGWIASFNARYLNDQRLNAIRIPAPTFTPIPTDTPVPTTTPLPYNTADVFTGLTVGPTAVTGPTATATARPRVATSTPSTEQRLQITHQEEFGGVFITDTVSALNTYSEQPINFTIMWQVMNDVTLALVNPDTAEEVFLRAYESNLDLIIRTVLNRSLTDNTLSSTGEERYANRKFIIGNVPDLRAFRYYTPCFTAQRLQQVQNDYNQLIAKEAAKYPGQVYVADLTKLAWTSHPQWVFLDDGLQLSIVGSDAVADVFGQVFQTLKL